MTTILDAMMKTHADRFVSHTSEAVNDYTKKSEDALERLQTIITCLQKYRVDIEKALVYGGSTHSFDYVCQGVMTGKIDLYELDNSVLLCEVHKCPNYNIYNVYIAAGDLEEILQFDSQLCKEAKLRGCSRVSFTGRKGWVRPLQSIGWDMSLVTMTKEVDNG